MTPAIKNRLYNASVWLGAALFASFSIGLGAHYLVGASTFSVAGTLLAVIIATDIGRHRKARRRRKALEGPKFSS